MKLTKKDKEILISGGTIEDDFPQIEAASTGRNTTYTVDNQRISRNKAIALLGRKNFLFGLARSAFHWSSCQTTPDGREVSFDSSKFFET